jgi:hypothetical protein
MKIILGSIDAVAIDMSGAMVSQLDEKQKMPCDNLVSNLTA